VSSLEVPAQLGRICVVPSKKGAARLRAHTVCRTTGFVTVKTPHESKTARFAGWPAKVIAERLLRELAVAGKA